MASFGNLSITLALTFCVYAMFALFVGARTGRHELTKSGERAVHAVFFFVSAAVVSLLYLLVKSDFTNEYVAGYSNRDLPLFYKLAALWGGQAGSLLFWSWILIMFGSIAGFVNRRRPGKLMPYSLGILCVTATFFLLINKFGVNPFVTLALDDGSGMMQPFAPADGRGLNPLLQHPAMVIHPPMLYLGYIGFVLPFSFCMAALLTRELGSNWIKIARRWTLVSWLFLTVGIILGGRWAYVELGWGGYWAWDPVENASLLPWLTGTAFLHSVIVQERKNMLKVWNVSLILATYMLSIFGTFLTRSGIVSSVHAFAQSSIGTYFLVFLIVTGAAATYLLVTRLQFLKSSNELDSYASREASFLFNNLVLLAACFAVLWGTIFPVISEMIQGEQVTVGAPFFNRINVPIGIFLLFLTGVGPLLAWRKTSLESMKRIFMWPTIFAVVTIVALIAFGIRGFYALMSFGMAAFVTVTLVAEFGRAALVRARNTGENILQSLYKITAINKRRYGGYIVHFGFVMLMVGFTGQAFTTEGWGEVGVGDEFEIDKYTIKCANLEDVSEPNYAGMAATLEVWKGENKLDVLEPEKRYYHASEQTTSEVRIRNTLKEDVYLVFAGLTEDNERAIIQVWVNPLVQWVWLGSLVMTLGTLVTLLPNMREQRIKQRKKQLEKLLEQMETVTQ